jgi:DNA invertase Pin-like site-specific DNA recombinase
MRKYVHYYRVSTRKQEESGLGLDAQHRAIADYTNRKPGEVIGEYAETETGKSAKKRPELQKAIAHANAAGAILVIAKLDRLARNVAFVSTLMESGLEFVACDVPTANRITIHVLAAVAEEEARLISKRTKEALAELKAQGVPLGSARPGHWEGMTLDGLHSRADRRRQGCLRGREAAHRNVKDEMMKRYEPIIPWIRELRDSGCTLQGVVDNLNRRGYLTRRGFAWTKGTVYRLIKRYLGDSYLGQRTPVVATTNSVLAGVGV